jgi:hypothetical protein
MRSCARQNIGSVYRGMDLDFKGFPAEDKRDPEACVSPPTASFPVVHPADLALGSLLAVKEALKELPPKSAVIIFTPCVPARFRLAGASP